LSALGRWVRGTLRATGRAGTGAEVRLDRLWFETKRRTGLLLPLEIQAYRGHGTPERLHVRARVIERTGVVSANARDSSWRNMRNMARRFLNDEVPEALVRVRAGGADFEATSDIEGYLVLDIDLPEPITSPSAWFPVTYELLWPKVRNQARVTATARVLIPRQAEFGVISDLDDTVVQTGVTRMLTMLRIALLSNAHTRLPFEGVAAFYRALERGPDGAGLNPVFYVSAGPWNLADLLEDFLDLNGVPRGPLFLRDWSPMTVKGQTQRHKLDVINGLLDTYPDLQFVLIGDSGEHDPEIYREVVRNHPGRIKAIYIRDVTSGPRSARVTAMARDLKAEHGVEMVLSADTAAAAAHAEQAGLIAPGPAAATEAAAEAEAETR
jgi:phosphatidate phosphatase APP1